MYAMWTWGVLDQHERTPYCPRGPVDRDRRPVLTHDLKYSLTSSTHLRKTRTGTDMLRRVNSRSLTGYETRKSYSRQIGTKWCTVYVKTCETCNN